jgi:hypothetical protein
MCKLFPDPKKENNSPKSNYPDTDVLASPKTSPLSLSKSSPKPHISIVSKCDPPLCYLLSVTTKNHLNLPQNLAPSNQTKLPNLKPTHSAAKTACFGEPSQPALFFRTFGESFHVAGRVLCFVDSVWPSCLRLQSFVGWECARSD